MFAALAIWVVMVGLIYDPPLSVKSGAIAFTLVCLILIQKAWRAPRLPYRRTELWYMLDREHGLPESRAQTVISQILQETYMRYAVYAAVFALPMWSLSFALRAFGWTAGPT